MSEAKRVESIDEVKGFLAKIKYLFSLKFFSLRIQYERLTDNMRNVVFTNRYTIATLFPDEDPVAALKNEVKTLSISEYMHTMKDSRFPGNTDFRVFGRKYDNHPDHVYIKLRVEIIPPKTNSPQNNVYIISFHFSDHSLTDTDFPYLKAE